MLMVGDDDRLRSDGGGAVYCVVKFVPESQTVPVATISPSVQEAAAQWLAAEARLVYDHTRGRGGVGMLQSCQERHGDRGAMATADAPDRQASAFSLFSR